MQAKYPGVHDPRIVRFKSGRHETFWSGNVVAIGNAYGFVEPLESTAIHMVIVELAYLTGCLASAGDGEPDRAFANERIGAHWDYLRGFLALHYRFNTRFDNAFWRAAREEADHSGNEAIVAKYREEGPFESMDGAGGNRADPTFGYHGAMLLLLGQQVASRGLRARTSREAWASRVGRQRALAERALAPLEAYRHLREHPELLRAAAGPDAWPRNTRERFVVSAVSRNAPFAETEWRPKRQHGFGALIDRAR
jgi:tryptophan halogenase